MPMSEPPSPTLRTALTRALRERCPECGEGRVFRSHPFQNEDDCDECGWAFERGPGHWLGGSEINMLLTFPLGIAVSLPLVLMTSGSAWSLALGAVLTVTLSLLTYRRSRCLFFALDHLLDPVPDRSSGGPPPRDGEEPDGNEPGPGPRPDRRARPRPDDPDANAPPPESGPGDRDLSSAPSPALPRRREPVRSR